MSSAKMYAICGDNFKPKSIGNSTFFTSSLDKDSIALDKGMMVEIFEENPNKTYTIKILNYYTEKFAWENNLFVCHKTQVVRVLTEVWPFVIAIVDPLERWRFCKSGQPNDILLLKEGDPVSVSGEAFNQNVSYDCVIRYIGQISEIGPGYYFGLELVNVEHGKSPQANDLYYLEKYMSHCNPALALILAANWITKPTKQSQVDKFLPKNIINSLICGVREIDRQLKVSKKCNKRSSLYELEDSNPKEPYNRALTPDLISQSVRSKEKSSYFGTDKVDDNLMESSKHKKIAASISSPNLSKQDSSSSTGSSGRYAGNGFDYEGALDRNYEGRSSQNSSNSSTLKHSRNKKIAMNSSNVKPSTIMSLEDRDLIVIDKADIKESTSNESDVIIVDPPPTLTSPENEHDLKDLLGMNWPMAAGEAAEILNNDKRMTSNAGGYSSSSSASTNSNYYNKYERNRSINPVSHLVSAKSSEMRKSKMMADASTMAKPNDTSPFYDNTNLPQGRTYSPENDIVPIALTEVPGNTSLGVGSLVEVSTDLSAGLYGVIRWIGEFPVGCQRNLLVGVELEEDQSDHKLQLNDGSLNGIRFFKCAYGRGIFVHPSQCTKDKRFLDTDPASPSTSKISKKSNTKMFGQVECPIVEGSVPPLKVLKPDDLEQMCGKFKGIQGHHNSCYLDATLFAMFTFTGVFDSLLFRPPEPEDNPHYEEVQKVLREEIVNPLRKNLFVRADRVMKLRQLLDKLSSVKGLMSEEKDPEEFLNSLLAQILRADPFLKLSSGLDTFYYQLFVEKDERLNMPTVQQLFEQSFLTSDIKLKEVPSCLIIQMPRFGKNFKMYPRILPSQVLDVTDIIEDSPRQCTVCGNLAEYECRECFGMLQSGVCGLENTAFCERCLETAHLHTKRTSHTPKALSVPQDYKAMAEHCPVPRLFMELFAVVCIETSHYVAFVKAASGHDAPWCFFDSMADRKGEQNGYNIPEMVPVADLPQWLSEEGSRSLHEAAANDKMLPEHAKRLLCDAYMCMYQSTDVMMYR